MHTRLYYYTGTGNSLWAARQLAERLDGEVSLVPLRADCPLPDTPCERNGLVFPVHMWGLPRRVVEFAGQFAGQPDGYQFAVALNAGQVSASLLQLQTLLQARGFPCKPDLACCRRQTILSGMARKQWTNNRGCSRRPNRSSTGSRPSSGTGWSCRSSGGRGGKGPFCRLPIGLHSPELPGWTRISGPKRPATAALCAHASARRIISSWNQAARYGSIAVNNVWPASSGVRSKRCNLPKKQPANSATTIRRFLPPT